MRKIIKIKSLNSALKNYLDKKSKEDPTIPTPKLLTSSI